MRATERLKLMERIGSKLQAQYTFAEIDAFFSVLGIDTDGIEYGMSKRVYSKDVLKRVSENTLIKVADELEITPERKSFSTLTPPANWVGVSDFRLFISHISKDKNIATRLKSALAPYNIAGFVAHEDIHPTLEWQKEIERALNTMDAFVAVHTKGFSQSVWTQQEIGFALGRGTKVISFKYDEDPTGFIGKHQALSRMNRNAEQIAQEIDELLSRDPQTSERLLEAKDAAAIPF